MSAAKGKSTECSVFSPAARRAAWKERRAGLILIAVGAFAVIESAPYGLGTLRQIGPGFFPTVLGAALVLLGGAIMLAPGSRNAEEDAGGAHAKRREPPDLRGWIAVISAVALFMVLTPWLGLVPGTFACVLAAALGDRSTTIVSAATLAAIVSVAGALVFVLGLRIPLPYFAF